MKLTLAEVAGVLGAEGAAAVGAYRAVTGYSIDSRSLAPGQLFFALRGPRFDGHQFVGQALERGAAGAVVEQDFYANAPAEWRSAMIPVADTLSALHLQAQLVYTNPVDPFNLYIKLSMMGGIFLASPFILYQLWMFISPGLYRNEKKYIWPFVLMTSGLFMSGGFFAYKLALPKVFYFLLNFANQFTPMVTINEYWDLAITLVVSVGLVFELPVVILLLSIFGIVTPKFLLKNFRYAVLLTAVIAAGIVPTNDMATIFVVWIPLLGLYVLSIGLSWLVYLKKNKKAKDADA